jgi:DNA repair photolyase
MTMNPTSTSEEVPAIYPTDIGADLIHQPVKVVLKVPAPPGQAVVPAKFLVRCMWPDVRASEAPRCCYCKLRENGGVDQIVDVALPPEDLVTAVGNERAFLETQARRSVRCFRDCSLVKLIDGQNLYFQTGFEPLAPDRQGTDGFIVEIISATGLPVAERIQVVGRVAEVGPKGIRLVHTDGSIEEAPEPPDEASRLRARSEVRRFLQMADPLDAVTRAVQRDITSNVPCGMSDMTAIVFLTIASATGLPLGGGNFSRRMQVLLLGDFGARKSTTVAAIMNAIGFGTLVGPRTSVAGLVGTVEEFRGIPQPRWGAMVREDRGLLAIEEGSVIPAGLVAAIRDVRERGWVSLHLRGTSYAARSRPAIVVCANPSMNRTLATYPIWAEALGDLKNHELADLRRFTCVVPVALDALSSQPIRTDDLPALSPETLRTIAWVARSVDADRVDLDPAAVALANAAEAELRRTLPRNACIEALVNHLPNKLLAMSTSWAIITQIPLHRERVRVTAHDVQAMLPLLKRILLAWTNRGIAETFDPEKVSEILRVLRDAAQSRGRKHRLDPLAGLRVLQAAPSGLTMREWAAHVGASDKTIRDAWLAPLFEPHGLVERVSSRYRITPLGRAVLAAAEHDPPPEGRGTGGSREDIANTDVTHDQNTEDIGGSLTISPTPEAVTDKPDTENMEITEIVGQDSSRNRPPNISPGITYEDFDPKPEDGNLRRMKVIWDDREQESALGRTDGLLPTFTHSLDPAVGCLFAPSSCGDTKAQAIAEGLGLRWCEFLYVKGRIPEALDRDLRDAMGRDAADPLHVSQLKVFMSPVTEPCAGPALGVTRDCLRVLARYPIGRLVFQTRSPKVLELLPELKALGKRVVVSFTIESDADDIWREVQPPMLPPLRERRKAVVLLHRNGVVTCVTVSPCARLADPEEFAVWIAMNADYAVVDTFVAGDGKGGTRTEKLQIPSPFASHGWTWSDETAARALYHRVQRLMGDRVGWSKEGFDRLATVPIPVR